MTHREHKHGLEIAYWRDNRACDKSEAQRCVVAPTSGNGWFRPFVFELPAESGDLESLLMLAESVEGFGAATARAEIRQALGVKG
jgi:hypothetical protein